MKRTYLIFDTETTGFLNKYSPPGHPNQPHIVQIAAELFKEDRVLGSINLIVDPGVEIPEAASKIHGITTKIAQAHGVRTSVAMAMFNNLAKSADCLAAHNASFDVGIVTNEYVRLEKEPEPFKKPLICTMLRSMNICKLDKPREYQRSGDMYKWPNLQEAYRVLVDPEGFEGAHDAMVDVVACRKVLFALLKMGAIPT